MDSNVLASALVARGLCAELFEAVLQSHTLLVSKPLMDELGRILPGKLGISIGITKEFLALLESQAERVTSPPESVELPDPDDVPIVGSALSGGADVFVTGDKALLACAMAREMPMVSPRDFWEILKRS